MQCEIAALELGSHFFGETIDLEYRAQALKLCPDHDAVQWLAAKFIHARNSEHLNIDEADAHWTIPDQITAHAVLAALGKCSAQEYSRCLRRDMKSEGEYRVLVAAFRKTRVLQASMPSENQQRLKLAAVAAREELEDQIDPRRID